MSEYKRLTKSAGIKNRIRYYITEPGTWASEVYNRLGELEDKIENGTVVELPCKVGQGCYRILRDENDGLKIVRLVVEGIAVFENMKMIYTNENRVPYREDEFGDIVFFDKTQAEKRLAELKGE